MNILFRRKPLGRMLLAIESLLVFSVFANADPVQFDGYGVTDWTATSTGTYDIVAYGAAGGGVHHYFGSNGTGGLGAQVEGQFILEAGYTLTLVLGEQGGDGPYTDVGSAGGGGATAVLFGPNDPLLIAGGGGGAGANPGANGLSASSYSASDGVYSNPNAGSNGAGGGGGGTTDTNTGEASGGGGGGGLNSAGGNGTGERGTGLGGAMLGPNSSSVPATYEGGYGGFDGGGSGGDDGYSGGGGGGGYSGGGGGGSALTGGLSTTGGYGGGAGGSLNLSGIYQKFTTNQTTSYGRVTITELTGIGAPTPVPEPANYLLSAFGLLSILGLSRRCRR